MTDGEETRVIRGSCLCGGVRFEVDRITGPFELCHCERCRKVSGSAFVAGLRVEAGALRFSDGIDLVRTFELPVVDEPPAYSSSFCSRCGSPVPSPSPRSGFVEVPAGLLDDDPGVRPDKHIFVHVKARWHDIADALPQLDEQMLRAHRRATRGR